MKIITLARIIAEMSVFLEFHTEEEIDPDVSVKGTELLIFHLRELEPEEMVELCSALREVSSDFRGDVCEFVKSLPELLGFVDEDDDRGTDATTRAS